MTDERWSLTFQQTDNFSIKFSIDKLVIFLNFLFLSNFQIIIYTNIQKSCNLLLRRNTLRIFGIKIKHIIDINHNSINLFFVYSENFERRKKQNWKKITFIVSSWLVQQKQQAMVLYACLDQYNLDSHLILVGYRLKD